mmetsp:Transcript_7408/g.25201  ORF Transcript_7408/g.25201 Transcript_7408/m.25201 type:complete len:200 (-) Transcript_7408:1509-2108(-)
MARGVMRTCVHMPDRWSGGHAHALIRLGSQVCMSWAGLPVHARRSLWVWCTIHRKRARRRGRRAGASRGRLQLGIAVAQLPDAHGPVLARVARHHLVVEELQAEDGITARVRAAARWGRRVLDPQAPEHAQVPQAQRGVHGEHSVVVLAPVEARAARELPLIGAQARDTPGVPKELGDAALCAQVPQLRRGGEVGRYGG